MRVLIYSPVRLFGECMAAFLETQNSVSAVLAEHDVQNLDLRATELSAEIALIDVTASKATSAALLVKSVCPAVSTIAMAVTEIPAEVIACAESGFDAYVPRTARPAELVAVMERVQYGETVCDPRITRMLFNELARRHAVDEPNISGSSLTTREVEIARLMAQGATNKEIATQLHLSVATVKNHVHSVLRKLRVEDRGHVATLLRENPLMLLRP